MMSPERTPPTLTDLQAEAREALDGRKGDTPQQAAKTIVRRSNLRVVLVVMDAGASIHEHRAPGTVVVQVLSGEVHLRLDERTVPLRQGHLLVVEPQVVHAVSAPVDSAFLLTIARETDTVESSVRRSVMSHRREGRGAAARGEPAVLHPALNPLTRMISKARIEVLVTQFYRRLCEDETLAPIFDRRLRPYDHHLEEMVAVWTTVLRSEPAYRSSDRGSPRALHQQLEGLDPAHLERWLQLFKETARDVFDPETADVVVARAARIGTARTSPLREDVG